jgi:hypothetical protein
MNEVAMHTDVLPFKHICDWVCMSNTHMHRGDGDLSTFTPKSHNFIQQTHNKGDVEENVLALHINKHFTPSRIR